MAMLLSFDAVTVTFSVVDLVTPPVEYETVTDFVPALVNAV